jgi:diacylglycerol kinase family enzyme
MNARASSHPAALPADGDSADRFPVKLKTISAVMRVLVPPAP